MELLQQVVGVTLVLIGVPLVLLMVAGTYANSSHAENRALKLIEAECARLGCTDIEAFTNGRSSFGVHYRVNGKRYRGKCSCWAGPVGKHVTWLNNDPREHISGDDKDRAHS